MKELQLIVTEFDLSGLHRHHFANSFSSKPPSSATIFRVAQGIYTDTFRFFKCEI